MRRWPPVEIICRFDPRCLWNITISAITTMEVRRNRYLAVFVYDPDYMSKDSSNSGRNNYRKRMAMLYALFLPWKTGICLTFDVFNAGSGNAITYNIWKWVNVTEVNQRSADDHGLPAGQACRQIVVQYSIPFEENTTLDISVICSRACDGSLAGHAVSALRWQ